MSSQGHRIIDIPPRWVLVVAKRALNRSGDWSTCYDVLAAYYGVRRVRAIVDPARVSPEADACYYRQQPGREPVICSKERAMDAALAFHEFGHHLHATLLKGRLTHEDNEFFAQEFATAVTRVWGDL